MSCGGTPRLPAIVVFARLPVEGTVKTRLAATIGNGKAVRVYQLCAEHVMMQGTRCHDTRCTVYCSDSRDQDAVCAWLSLLKLDIPVKNQISASNLGERIYHALHAELEKGAPKVVIVGTDVPDLSRDILHQALQALDSNDMVLGPAMDGGYYLLGLKRLEPELFHSIEWSTPTVLASQVANAERLGYSLAALDTLPRLRDIDVVQDLQEWCMNGDTGHPLKQPLQAVLANVPL